jgi:formylglycine-generating enzyme required for sulfatase activity
VSFFNELKRRHVFKVATGYVVMAWLVMQVADVVLNNIAAPDWVFHVLLLFLAIGFPVAIFLAWAYDLTPDGIKVTGASDGSPVTKTSISFLFPLLVVVLGLVAGGWWYLGKAERWVHGEALPAIETFVERGELEAAYALALQVETTRPDDADMAEIWSSFSWITTIESTPAGATVYRRPYENAEADWQELGVTPLHDIHVPFGLMLLKFELDNHVSLLRVIGGGSTGLTKLPVQEKPGAGWGNIHPGNFRLFTSDSIPEGMVSVPGWNARIDAEQFEFRDFFIGRYEVTNREFQAFVDAGGYRRKDLWEHEFIDAGQTLSFDQAMALFVDKTGRPGPGAWEAGSYPNGQGDFPVAGVSWYEAMAYARFTGYELPTIHHWRRALAIGMLTWQLPASNLEGEGVSAVGTFNGIGWTGTYDMAGNVSEWCFNATGDQKRAIVGGAWNDFPYMVEESISSPGRRAALDRSATNGFRLASTNEEARTMQAAAKPVLDAEVPQLADPVSDAVFAARLSDFEYDDEPLNAVIEEVTEFRHWTRQRITFDSPVDEARMTVYLYLPERESSRHQTVLFWPGSSTQYIGSVEQTRTPLDFVLRTGRAVAYPIMKGMFERRVRPPPDWQTHKGRDLAIEEVREFRRMIDYLETRPDIESDNLAYYGKSWGGRMGAIVLAVEPRIKTGILNQAGINAGDHPDINVVHFLPRVHVPVLQFSGLYDTDFRFESSSKPFFDRLGTDEEDKKHVVEPSNHFVPAAIMKGETLDWLDKYLGPVDH